MRCSDLPESNGLYIRFPLLKPVMSTRGGNATAQVSSTRKWRGGCPLWTTLAAGTRTGNIWFHSRSCSRTDSSAGLLYWRVLMVRYSRVRQLCYLWQAVFHPNLEVGFCAAISELAQVDGRWALIKLATEAQDEVEARFLVNFLHMLLQYQRDTGAVVTAIETGTEMRGAARARTGWWCCWRRWATCPPPAGWRVWWPIRNRNGRPRGSPECESPAWCPPRQGRCCSAMAGRSKRGWGWDDRTAAEIPRDGRAGLRVASSAARLSIAIFVGRFLAPAQLRLSTRNSKRNRNRDRHGVWPPTTGRASGQSSTTLSGWAAALD